MKKESKNWSKFLVQSVSKSKLDKRRYRGISRFQLWQ